MKLAQPLASSWVDIMTYVLRLLTEDEKKYYIGYTNNLRRRIAEHKKNKTYTTRRMNNPELVYYEAYNIESAAKTREKKLKQFGSSYRGLIKRIGLI